MKPKVSAPLLQGLRVLLDHSFWFTKSLETFLLTQGFLPEAQEPRSRAQILDQTLSFFKNQARPSDWETLAHYMGQMSEPQDLSWAPQAPAKHQQWVKAKTAFWNLYRDISPGNLDFPGKTWAQILEIPGPCSPEALKAQVRDLLKYHHPDLNPAPGAREKTQEILRAYEELQILWFGGLV